MQYLKLFTALLMLFIGRLKGSKTVYETHSADNALGSLRGYSVRGYEITIFCQRKQYAVKYDKWYIPNVMRTSYRVVGVVTNDAPEALKQACDIYLDLPSFISESNFSHEIRRSVVLAYLDLLEKRLGPK